MGSVVVVVWFSCPAPYGIFLGQGSNLRPLHWRADSQPLGHQEFSFFFLTMEGSRACGQAGEQEGLCSSVSHSCLLLLGLVVWQQLVPHADVSDPKVEGLQTKVCCRCVEVWCSEGCAAACISEDGAGGADSNDDNQRQRSPAEDRWGASASVDSGWPRGNTKWLEWHSFLTVLRLGVPRLPQTWCLVRACFLDHRWLLLAVSSPGGKNKCVLWSFFLGHWSHSWGLQPSALTILKSPTFSPLKCTEKSPGQCQAGQIDVLLCNYEQPFSGGLEGASVFIFCATSPGKEVTLTGKLNTRVKFNNLKALSRNLLLITQDSCSFVRVTKPHKI